MDDHCLVVCGEWICSEFGVWDWTSDKNMMGRFVEIHKGMSLSEMEESLVSEFAADGSLMKSVQLSYALPGDNKLITGQKPPPIMITTDSAFSFFVRKFLGGPNVFLCAELQWGSKRKSPSSEKGPDQMQSGIVVGMGNVSSSRNVRSSNVGSSVGCSMGVANARTNSPSVGGVVNSRAIYGTPPSTADNRCGFRNRHLTGTKDGYSAIHPFDIDSSVGVKKFGTVGSSSSGLGFKTPMITELNRCGFTSGGFNEKNEYVLRDNNATPTEAVDPEIEREFLAEVDAVEAEYAKLSDVCKYDKLCEKENEEDVDVGPDEQDVRPLNFDAGFWTPLLNDQFGGSNALEFAHSTHTVSPSAAAVTPPIPSKPYTYACNTNSTFDHLVMAGGTAPAKPEFSFPQLLPLDGAVGGSLEVPRKLADIDDEEFDIPPMFDDMLYERNDIPDLDRFDENEKMFVGKMFDSKQDCQISLAIFAIKEQFYFRQTTTKAHYFVLNCPHPNCDWRVLAGELKGSTQYQIKKAEWVHKCPVEVRNKFAKKATNKVLASVYKNKFSNVSSRPKPLDLQQLILEELRVSTSYKKCWEVKESSISGARGNEEEAYLRLPKYLEMLKLANPGTVADIETDPEEDGSERFLYLFLAFGASIRGFRYVRKLIVLDGTHLSGKYKGIFLTASGQDANCQVYPLAFAVVDSENDDSWTWFLMKLERIIADSTELSFISDRHGSIANALTRVFPKSHHGACILHLERNVNSEFKVPGLAEKVGKAACAYRVGNFRKAWGEVKAASPTCATYLEKIGIKHWSRAHFTGKRYNLMTSNIAETLNKALLPGRGCSILDLLMVIQQMMTRWFDARRRKSSRHAGDFPPEIDKQISANMRLARGSKINSANDWKIEIIGPLGAKHSVCLYDKKCACMVYNRLGFPCQHAVMAADYKNVPYKNLALPWCKTPAWFGAYEVLLIAELDWMNVLGSEEYDRRVIRPPRTKRPTGRPRTVRRRSTGDFKKVRVKKVKVNRCGRCHNVGHNRSRCNNPIG